MKNNDLNLLRMAFLKRINSLRHSDRDQAIYECKKLMEALEYIYTLVSMAGVYHLASNLELHAYLKNTALLASYAVCMAPNNNIAIDDAIISTWPEIDMASSERERMPKTLFFSHFARSGANIASDLYKVYIDISLLVCVCSYMYSFIISNENSTETTDDRTTLFSQLLYMHFLIIVISKLKELSLNTLIDWQKQIKMLVLELKVVPSLEEDGVLRNIVEIITLSLGIRNLSDENYNELYKEFVIAFDAFISKYNLNTLNLGVLVAILPHLNEAAEQFNNKYNDENRTSLPKRSTFAHILENAKSVTQPQRRFRVGQ